MILLLSIMHLFQLYPCSLRLSTTTSSCIFIRLTSGSLSLSEYSGGGKKKRPSNYKLKWHERVFMKRFVIPKNKHTPTIVEIGRSLRLKKKTEWRNQFRMIRDILNQIGFESTPTIMHKNCCGLNQFHFVGRGGHYNTVSSFTCGNILFNTYSSQ